MGVISLNLNLTGVLAGTWVMNLHLTVNGVVVPSGITATLEDTDINQDVKISVADVNGNIAWDNIPGYNKFPEIRHKYIIHAWYNVEGVDVLTDLWPVWLGMTKYCIEEKIPYPYPGGEETIVNCYEA